jgi:hypothetical protein
MRKLLVLLLVPAMLLLSACDDDASTWDSGGRADPGTGGDTYWEVIEVDSVHGHLGYEDFAVLALTLVLLLLGRRTYRDSTSRPSS